MMDNSLANNVSFKSKGDPSHSERRLSGPGSSIKKKFNKFRSKKKNKLDRNADLKQEYLLSLLSDATNTSWRYTNEYETDGKKSRAFAGRLPNPDHMNLIDLVQDQSMLSDFYSFLKSQYCEESLEFWLDCQQYKEIFKQGDLGKIRTKGIEMNTKYFSFAASKPINVDHESKLRVTRDLTHFKEDTFYEAEQQCLQLITSDCYPRYYAQAVMHMDIDRYQPPGKSNSMRSHNNPPNKITKHYKEPASNISMDTISNSSVWSSSTRPATGEKLSIHGFGLSDTNLPSHINNSILDSSESGNTTYYSIISKSPTVSKSSSFPNSTPMMELRTTSESITINNSTSAPKGSDFETLCDMLDGVHSVGAKAQHGLKYYVEALDSITETDSY